MAELDDIRKLFFIGIGGIGMSALARYFRSEGREVYGYDRTETPLTRELVREGIAVTYEDDPATLPKDVDLVVYTPAIPKDHRGLAWYRANGYEVKKRSEVLGLVTRSSLTICVAGTHGKTTISTMTAHILRHTGYGCNAFLGGISANYGTNFWSAAGKPCVVEADEYDRSFLQLSPDYAVISSMDADHLDIYGTEAAVREAFNDFARKLKPGGTLFAKDGLPLDVPKPGTIRLRYGAPAAEIRAERVRVTDGGYRYDVTGPGGTLADVELPVGGRHNVENSLPAIAIARALGIAGEKIRAAVAAFAGVRRRFEYRARTERVVYLDDYAHHPRELAALLGSARELFPGREMLLLFQPHLFTRTRDFADGFAATLDQADDVVLLPVYPARELPIEGVTSELLLGKMKNERKRVLNKQEALDYVAARAAKGGPLLVITAGAGDIDTLTGPIAESIEKSK